MVSELVKVISQETYITPTLIATRAPIFSVLNIVLLQTIFHGNNASTISATPE